VACVHGLTLDKSIFDGFVRVLEAAGLASLRVDLRGHGGSGGRLEDQGFLDQGNDVRAAFEAMALQPGADPARRGLLGFSMGGALGALAAFRLRPRALALWSPLLKTGPWDEARGRDFGPPQGGLRTIWDGIRVHERLFSEAQALDPFGAALAWEGPLLLCHGAKDRNHPQRYSLELASARARLARPATTYFPPLSGHAWKPESERAQRDILSAEFFRDTL
jgi:alpha-beta hydrolase superfamily lysophospholipase